MLFSHSINILFTKRPKVSLSHEVFVFYNKLTQRTKDRRKLLSLLVVFVLLLIFASLTMLQAARAERVVELC